jgi:hypothetical protein
MAKRAAVLIRGIRMPLLFDFTSRMALTSGGDPSVLMAKFCELVQRQSSIKAAKIELTFFIEFNV